MRGAYGLYGWWLGSQLRYGFIRWPQLYIVLQYNVQGDDYDGLWHDAAMPKWSSATLRDPNSYPKKDL